MKMLEKRPAMLMITEHIEMELFASEESCVVVSVQDTEEDYCSYYRHLEHPLVSVTEEAYPVPQVQSPPEQQFKLKRVLSVGTEDLDDCPLVPDSKEDMEIELEVSTIQTICIRLFAQRFPPVASLNQVTRVKWRKVFQQRTGLVVKDVICLPRGHLLAHPDRHGAPQGKERMAMAAMGMTARIIIDCGWSTSEMESRLVSHFHGQLGQRFSFTYLQSVQGSRALFVPDPPVEGWTGEQVLQICGHGPLYILSRHDYTQPLINTYLALAQLEFALRKFRRHAVDPSLQLLVTPSWTEPLLSALRMLGSPGFCYRATPDFSLCDTKREAGGHQLNLREFFRLALLELQHSSVFEGSPGRLFLTYDLTALEDRKYYKAGVLIGWSLAHGGPGPQCMHPAFYQLMCGQNAFLDDFDWRDVTNPEAQVRMKQHQSATNLELLSGSPCAWAKSSGLPENDSADHSSIYASLVKHYIYHRVASMAAQFTDGLDSCGGLWETVCAHWEAFAPVMTSADCGIRSGERCKTSPTIQ
ncbi:unnamed protein product [Lota lota]